MAQKNMEVLAWESCQLNYYSPKLDFDIVGTSTYEHKFVISFNKKCHSGSPGFFGIGGAFTDSASVLFGSMPKEVQEKVIDLYFKQAKYNFCRIPISSTDFSCRNVKNEPTFQEECDVEKSQYHLQYEPTNKVQLSTEDIKYRIPFIKMAQQVNPNMLFLGSAWSAPPFMKSNTNTVWGSLERQYYESWAKHFEEFLDNYKDNDINISFVTLQNEPVENGFSKNIQKWQTMYFTFEEQRNFSIVLKQVLMNKYPDVKIIAHDDQILTLQKTADAIGQHPIAKKSVDGFGVHWYMNRFTNQKEKLQNCNALIDKHWDDSKKKPFLIGTEACEGYIPITRGPLIGSWDRAMRYAKDIVIDLSHGFLGWIDWNMILDTKGGPNWIKNYTDASILYDPKKQDIIVQPTYHVLKHFSSGIPIGSHLMKTETKSDILHCVFANANMDLTIIFVNTSIFQKKISIKLMDESFIQTILKCRSITSFVIKNK